MSELLASMIEGIVYSSIAWAVLGVFVLWAACSGSPDLIDACANWIRRH